MAPFFLYFLFFAVVVFLTYFPKSPNEEMNLINKAENRVFWKKGFKSNPNGWTEYGVHLESIHFNTDEMLTIDSARKHIIECVKIYADTSSGKLREPFSHSNLNISIASQYNSNINAVVLHEGKIFYKKIKSSKNIENVYEETYEEALEKLKIMDSKGTSSFGRGF